jgi:hypothetical protein
MELRRVEGGRRSTLYVSREGALYRQYHDTEHWDGPLPVCIDAGGVARCMGNRRLDRVVELAFGEEKGGFRGGRSTGEAAPSGSAETSASSSSGPSPYLRLVARRPTDIAQYARALDVEVSTAWNYLARVVEVWPRAQGLARAVVYPPLLAAVAALEDRTGALREVMARLSSLAGDTAWREVGDRYAHLRLARLCVEAAAEEERAKETTLRLPDDAVS